MTSDDKRSTKIGVGGLMAKLIIKSAMNYKNPPQAFSEYTQNGADEPKARKIWIVLDKANDTIYHGDDGGGMGRNMTAEDTELVELFYSIIEDNQSPGCDLRELVSEPSMHTLAWLATNIANSAKGEIQEMEAPPNLALQKHMKAMGIKRKTPPKRSTFGMFGIGAWSYLYFANKLQIYTRPSKELAELLKIEQDVFSLIFPTRRELNSLMMGGELQTVGGDLPDINNNPLESGTVCVISGIDKNAWDYFTVDSLVAYYRDAFGTRLASKEGGLEIRIRDLATGREEKVPAQVIKGQVLVDDTFKSIDGAKCDILIWYDPKSRGIQPRVTKLGGTICPLSEVFIKGKPAFEGAWISGSLGGHIAFEHERDDNLFDTSKHGLLETNALRHWVARVKEFEPTIKRAIEAIERDARDERLLQAANLLGEALNSTLKNAGISFGGSAPREKEAETKPRTPQPEKSLRDIIISVVDRNNRGIPGMKVEIKGPDRNFAKTTGASGKAQLEKPLDGNYTVTLLGNYPLVDGQKNPVQFKIIGEVSPGWRVKFMVDEGEDLPKLQHGKGSIEVAFTVWDDPGEPWRQSISAMGVVEFNVAKNSELRSLFERHHWEEADVLMAEYTIAAIMEALKESGDHVSRVRQSSLFTKLYLHLKESRAEGTRAARKRKP